MAVSIRSHVHEGDFVVTSAVFEPFCRAFPVLSQSCARRVLVSFFLCVVCICVSGLDVHLAPVLRNGPIILTGFSALNKLLGREVYTSQDQLGGPQVKSSMMHI